MKFFLSFTIFFTFALTQCNPLEVAIYLNEKDGWMFPYSAFYWGMSDGVNEIINTNPECIELIQNNEACIQNCIFPETTNDQYNGRIGCIYYNCLNGEQLIQNYEELMERPIHLYGQYYCEDETLWNEETDKCESLFCNGDLNFDNEKNVQDIIIMVNEILNENSNCD